MKIDDYIILGGAGQLGKTSAGNESKPAENQVSFADQLSQVLQQALIESTSKDVNDKDELEAKRREEQDLLGRINNKVALARATESQAAAAMPLQDSVNVLDDLLGMLEKYEEGLANPATSLKDLGSLVNSMQAKATALEQGLEFIDSSLNPLANQIISQAHIEAIKFQRGDYVE